MRRPTTTPRESKIEEIRATIIGNAARSFEDYGEDVAKAEAETASLLDSLIAATKEEERERIWKACREFKAGDTLVINAPTLLLERSVLNPRRH